MSTDDLPTEYDDIVIGTGVQEGIIAAALARNGHKVLHLDRNDYYSGEWASFHLKGILDWIKRNQSSAVDESEIKKPEDLEEGLEIVPLPSPHQTATNIEVEIHVKEKADVVDIPNENLTSKTDEGGGPSVEPSGSLEPEHTAQEKNSEIHTSSSDGSHVTGDQEDSKEIISSQSQPEECKTHTSSDDVSNASSANEDTKETTVTQSSPGDGEIQTSSVNVDNTETGDDSSKEAVNEPSEPKEESTSQAAKPDGQSAPREWTWEDIFKDWRKFNIDLAPKLMFCRGAMVDLLVSSRISRYAEFKAVTRILTYINDKLEQVPCSRADVFSSRYVSMLEKRMLMKIIEFCLDHENRQEEYKDHMDKPFTDFLRSRKLSPTLQHFVIHSIAMISASTPTQEALKAMKYFLSSLGRYGNTAFLWTLYGSGELPQCFCRMCAVFGGIYVLRTSVSSMIKDSENNIKGIIDSEGKILKCRNLIMEYSYTYCKDMPYNSSYVSRGILITNKSLKPSTSEQITFLTIPPREGKDHPVHVIEVGYAASAAPRHLYLVHLTTKASNKDVSAKNDLLPVVNSFFQLASKDSVAPEYNDDAPPLVLWSMYFTQEDVTDVSDDALNGLMPGNVYVTSGAGRSIGFDHAVSQAKRIFEKICPGDEFLPAAPDPEDLVFEDQGKENTSQAGFESTGKSEEKRGTEEAKGTDESKESEETKGTEESKRKEELKGVEMERTEESMDSDESRTTEEHDKTQE